MGKKHSLPALRQQRPTKRVFSTCVVTTGSRLKVAVDPSDDRPRLRPSDLGFGQLFAVVGDAVIVGEVSSGRVVLWNPAAERIFGYPADEAVGMPIEELIPPPLRSAHREGLSRFLTRGETRLVGTGRPAELPARRKDGSEFWVDLTLTPMETPAVPGRFVLAIVRDVTERRRSQAHLAATNRAMREFLVMAAHDLRSPVTTIVCAAELICQAAESHVTDLGAVISRQAQHLGQIISELADLGQIEVGETKVNPTDVSVIDAVDEALEACRLAPGAPAVDIADGLRVWVDPDHLRRMLENYLTNAEKYAAAGICVRARIAGEYIDIGVVDDGPGVPPEFVPRLFDKFTRPATTGHPPGRGIGLAIVAGLARINGGTAWYEPNRPTGSQFWVRLPAQRNLTPQG